MALTTDFDGSGIIDDYAALTTDQLHWANGQAERAGWAGQDVAKWLRTFKALATKRNRGLRISEHAVRNAANEAYFAARSAAKFGNRVLDLRAS